MTTQNFTHRAASRPRAWGLWPLERILFAMAGSVTLGSVLLGVVVSPWWLLLAAFAGVNQLVFVAFGECVASLVLTRLFGVERGCVR